MLKRVRQESDSDRMQDFLDKAIASIEGERDEDDG
jgi:hypothetical protein